MLISMMMPYWIQTTKNPVDTGTTLIPLRVALLYQTTKKLDSAKLKEHNRRQLNVIMKG